MKTKIPVLIPFASGHDSDIARAVGLARPHGVLIPFASGHDSDTPMLSLSRGATIVLIPFASGHDSDGPGHETENSTTS